MMTMMKRKHAAQVKAKERRKKERRRKEKKKTFAHKERQSMR